jgi:membrane protease YdiL (CAAX protease family)
VAPRPGAALAGLAIYLVVFYGAWVVTGIQYTAIGENARSLWLWYVLPLSVGALVTILVVTALGWWRPVIFERNRLGRAWLAFPILYGVFAIVNLAGKDLSEVTPLMWLLLVLGSLLVGFNEEVVTRGILVVGLRGRYGEAMVWFLSTLLFGLMHLPNWVFGAGPSAITQVGMTFLAGTVLYLVRRSTGSLVWAILLHGLWDFAAFAGTGTAMVGTALEMLLGVVGVVLLLVLFAKARRRSAAEQHD